MIALAVREMGLTPAQAPVRGDGRAAKSVRRADVGRIAVGGRADLAVIDAPSHRHLAYRPGVPLVSALEVWSILQR